MDRTASTSRRDDAAPAAQADSAASAPQADRDQPGDWLPEKRISWFPIPDEASLDPRVAELVAKQRAKLGAPNNIVRVHAWRPDIMLRWLELFDHITKGPSGLSRVDREMIGVVVSSENRCMLCLASHGAELRRLSGDPVLSERVVLDYRRAGLDPRTRAMLDYAIKITRNSVECTEQDIAALRAHGFSDDDVYDIINTAAIYAYNNRVANASGHLPDRSSHGAFR